MTKELTGVSMDSPILVDYNKAAILYAAAVDGKFLTPGEIEDMIKKGIDEKTAQALLQQTMEGYKQETFDRRLSEYLKVVPYTDKGHLNDSEIEEILANPTVKAQWFAYVCSCAETLLHI